MCKGHFDVFFLFVLRQTTPRHVKTQFQFLISGIITQPIVMAAISARW